MIKTQVKCKSSTDKPFPKLMINNTRTIVLFAKSGRGIVLIKATPNAIEEEGEYYNSWNMNLFKDYNDEIVLKND